MYRFNFATGVAKSGENINLLETNLAYSDLSPKQFPGGSPRNALNHLMIKAVIFDMDGVLIDSEPLWQEAQIRVFARTGVQLTPEMCQETTGLRVDEVVTYRYNKHRWPARSREQVQADILTELERLIVSKGEAMPGVEHALSFFEKQGLRLALASSTHFRLIKVILKKLGIANRFEAIHSAEFEEYGKPHPGIYITTLTQLGLEVGEVLAIEDSVNGVLAATAAGLKTICIPELSARNDTRFDIAELKLTSLEEIGMDVLCRFNDTCKK